MKYLLKLFLFLTPFVLLSQEHELSIFENLVGKTWKAEGNWGDGSKFFQEIDVRYSMDKSIVVLESIGFIDKDQTQIGLRNHGIRQYDSASKSIRFWEYDVFGGLTKGTVSSIGNDIMYQYSYAETFVTDYWTYVNDSTYNLKIGVFENGEWKQTFSNVVFKAKNISEMDQMYSTLKNKLIGNWSSKAWDGVLML